ncbi:MAG: hypothetical protein WAJ85_13300 [Candidatus Baltobacteraceae bacterium]|jgi:hypothetical protein
MNPKDPAPLPVDELRAAAADHPGAHPAIDALHAAVTAENPDAATIQRHVEELRKTPPLVAALERWWLDPRTQAFIAELNAAGL